MLKVFNDFERKPELLAQFDEVVDCLSAAAVFADVNDLLLQEAEKIGCSTIDGVAMFVHQGAVQFELWTHKKAPLELMRRVVLEALAGR